MTVEEFTDAEREQIARLQMDVNALKASIIPIRAQRDILNGKMKLINDEIDKKHKAIANIRQLNLPGTENMTKAQEILDLIGETIHHEGDKWVVKSKDGKVLGTHDTEKEAKAQLAAIEISKHGG